jgi:hypothetical protein
MRTDLFYMRTDQALFFQSPGSYIVVPELDLCDRSLGLWQLWNGFVCAWGVGDVRCFCMSLYITCFPMLAVTCISRPIGIIINHNQRDATILDLFISKLIYMFQTVSPPIIRSTCLNLQLRVLSTNTAGSCFRGWDGTLVRIERYFWSTLVPSHSRKQLAAV